jgi:hypothetical protein
MLAVIQVGETMQIQILGRLTHPPVKVMSPPVQVKLIRFGKQTQVASLRGEMMQIQILGRQTLQLVKVTLQKVLARPIKSGKPMQVEFQHGETMQILGLLIALLPMVM